MKLHQSILMIILLIVGTSIGETATFIYKNGSVEFGEFRRMAGDSVFLEKATTGAAHELAVISRQLLAEVVFDSGDKLDLSLTEYPAAAPAVAVQPAAPVPTTPVSVVTDVPQRTAPVPQGGLRSPFVYGGISAIVPGLGQILQGKRGKGAACFGIVGVSALGALLAWNYTTAAYNKLENNKTDGGTYQEADFKTFTFRLHGSRLLTGISAILYTLNVADASADAFAYNKYQLAVQPGISLSTKSAACSVAFAF